MNALSVVWGTGPAKKGRAAQDVVWGLGRFSRLQDRLSGCSDRSRDFARKDGLGCLTSEMMVWTKQGMKRKTDAAKTGSELRIFHGTVTRGMQQQAPRA